VSIIVPSVTPIGLQGIVLCLAISMSSPPYRMGMSAQVSESIIKEAVGKLYSDAITDRETARQVLLSAAQESTDTKELIIKASMMVLENSEAAPTKKFTAWRAAAEILGELKASSAIDTLVAHLDYTDGTLGFSLSPFPAAQALIRIGQPAVPLLVGALSHERSAVRSNAARALGLIGGPLATQALRRQFPTESDPQVQFYILAALSRLARP
jgi:HEAT repeat protein